MRRSDQEKTGRRLAGALALGLLMAGGAEARTQSIVILHDNDLHGHLRPFCYTEVGRGPGEHCGVGGAARRATLIARLKRRIHDPVALVDAGDTTERGPLTTQYEGRDAVEAMNAIGYDLAAVGNTEFRLKGGIDRDDAAGAQASLQALFRAARFPWLCANVTTDDGRPLPGVKPFVVRRMGALRVAFLGLTTLKSASYGQTKGLRFQDPVEAARLWIPRARAEADVVVAVTHLGVEGDVWLAHESRGVDAIVGGDSHTFLYAMESEPNLDGAPVPIVQDGEFGVNLGEYRLTFETGPDGRWRLKAAADRLVPVSAALPPDPRIARLVERYAAPMDAPAGQVSAIAADAAGRRRQTADLLAAAWRAATGADVGLEPEAAPYEAFRTRQVTRYQVHAILPFHEDVGVVNLTGAQLSALMQKTTLPTVGALHLWPRSPALDPLRTYKVGLLRSAAESLGLQGWATSGGDARTSLESFIGKPRPDRSD